MKRFAFKSRYPDMIIEAKDREEAIEILNERINERYPPSERLSYLFDRDYNGDETNAVGGASTDEFIPIWDMEEQKNGF